MIETLKDLEKLMTLCRKQGVFEIEVHGVKLKLGDLPASGAVQSEQPDKLAKFPSGELTPEQLMFYSSGGAPEDDPALKDQGDAA